MIGVAEHVAGGLVDGHGPGARGRVGLGAAMDLAGLEAPCILGHWGPPLTGRERAIRVRWMERSDRATNSVERGDWYRPCTPWVPTTGRLVGASVGATGLVEAQRRDSSPQVSFIEAGSDEGPGCRIPRR